MDLGAFTGVREVTELSKWNCKAVWLCLLGILLGIGNVLSQPCLFVMAAGEIAAITPAYKGTPVSIRFIHSVQKTPVLENLAVAADGQGLLLHSTKYQSFGVGLPFLASEGSFHEEGDYFVFDHMERYFPKLTLRTGVGTKLTLYLRGREYPLYEKYPPGTAIDIFVSPFGKGMLL